MSFNDLVRRLHAMETGEDTAAAAPKPLSELDPERRAVKETANVLQAFDAITEGKAPSAEIVADRDDEAEEVEAPKPISRTAPKPNFDPDEDALDPVVESKYDFSDEDEVVTESDDVSSMIRQRFSQFMQSEMKGGADIDTISSAITEGSETAKKIHAAYQSLTMQLQIVQRATEEGSRLYKAIEAEGGDTKKLQEANKKIEQALAAMRKSHTYAMPGMDSE